MLKLVKKLSNGDSSASCFRAVKSSTLWVLSETIAVVRVWIGTPPFLQAPLLCRKQGLEKASMTSKARLEGMGQGLMMGTVGNEASCKPSMLICQFCCLVPSSGPETMDGAG